MKSVLKDSTPKLHELDLFKRNGKKVRIIDETAVFWKKIALGLHFKQYDVKRIANDCPQDSRLASHRMYSEWLDGNNRQPVSWSTLIEVFIEVKMWELANKLQFMLNIISQDKYQDTARQCKLY